MLFANDLHKHVNNRESKVPLFLDFVHVLTQLCQTTSSLHLNCLNVKLDHYSAVNVTVNTNG